MVDCPELPATGGGSLALLLMTALLVGLGVALLLIVRPRGVGRGASVVFVLALGATSLVVSDARRAGAASCPSPTTVAGTVSPTSVASATTVPPTTAAATTTTAVTTTTTTTTLPESDLTPSIVGPPIGFSGQYVISVTNVGDAPTSGPMTFTLTLAVLNGPGPILPATVNSADWASAANPSGLTFTSNAGLVIAPGAASVVRVLLEWRVDAPGSWQGTVTLPSGIGGEANGANNTDSITVVIPPPP